MLCTHLHLHFAITRRTKWAKPECIPKSSARLENWKRWVEKYFTLFIVDGSDNESSTLGTFIGRRTDMIDSIFGIYFSPKGDNIQWWTRHNIWRPLCLGGYSRSLLRCGVRAIERLRIRVTDRQGCRKHDGITHVCRPREDVICCFWNVSFMNVLAICNAIVFAYSVTLSLIQRAAPVFLQHADEDECGVLVQWCWGGGR
jgi:hypothetical protein